MANAKTRAARPKKKERVSKGLRKDTWVEKQAPSTKQQRVDRLFADDLRMPRSFKPAAPPANPDRYPRRERRQVKPFNGVIIPRTGILETRAKVEEDEAPEIIIDGPPLEAAPEPQVPMQEPSPEPEVAPPSNKRVAEEELEDFSPIRRRVSLDSFMDEDDESLGTIDSPSSASYRRSRSTSPALSFDRFNAAHQRFSAASPPPRPTIFAREGYGGSTYTNTWRADSPDEDLDGVPLFGEPTTPVAIVETVDEEDVDMDIDEPQADATILSPGQPEERIASSVIFEADANCFSPVIDVEDQPVVPNSAATTVPLDFSDEEDRVTEEEEQDIKGEEPSSEQQQHSPAPPGSPVVHEGYEGYEENQYDYYYDEDVEMSVEEEGPVKEEEHFEDSGVIAETRLPSVAPPDSPPTAPDSPPTAPHSTPIPCDSPPTELESHEESLLRKTYSYVNVDIPAHSKDDCAASLAIARIQYKEADTFPVAAAFAIQAVRADENNIEALAFMARLHAQAAITSLDDRDHTAAHSNADWAASYLEHCLKLLRAGLRKRNIPVILTIVRQDLTFALRCLEERIFRPTLALRDFVDPTCEDSRFEAEELSGVGHEMFEGNVDGEILELLDMYELQYRVGMQQACVEFNDAYWISQADHAYIMHQDTRARLARLLIGAGSIERAHKVIMDGLYHDKEHIELNLLAAHTSQCAFHLSMPNTGFYAQFAAISSCGGRKGLEGAWQELEDAMPRVGLGLLTDLRPALLCMSIERVEKNGHELFRLNEAYFA